MPGHDPWPIVLVNLGAVLALLAAGAWWRDWRKDRNDAKLLTALALSLVSVGYLWARVVGAIA